VTFARVDWAVVGQIPVGPTSRGEAVELYPGLPGMADASPEGAEELAAVIGLDVLGGVEHKIGFAVEGDVSAVVAVWSDFLGLLPERRILHRFAGLRHLPL